MYKQCCECAVRSNSLQYGNLCNNVESQYSHCLFINYYALLSRRLHQVLHPVRMSVRPVHFLEIGKT